MADYVYRKPRGRKHKRYGRANLGKLVYKHLRKHIPVYAIELERLRAMWGMLVPPRVAKRTYPARLMKGVLWVHVHDNQWLHELGYLRQEILDRLHQEPNFRNITAIELRLGRIPVGQEPAPYIKPPGANRPLEPEAPVDTEQALEAVTDPNLRALMRKARDALGRKDP